MTCRSFWICASPSCMIEPLPNCFSICASAALRAFVFWSSIGVLSSGMGGLQVSPIRVRRVVAPIHAGHPRTNDRSTQPFVRPSPVERLRLAIGHAPARRRLCCGLPGSKDEPAVGKPPTGRSMPLRVPRTLLRLFRDHAERDSSIHMASRSWAGTDRSPTAMSTVPTIAAVRLRFMTMLLLRAPRREVALGFPGRGGFISSCTCPSPDCRRS